jgi:hypothetical protein
VEECRGGVRDDGFLESSTSSSSSSSSSSFSLSSSSSSTTMNGVIYTNSSNLFSEIYCKIKIIAGILEMFWFFNNEYFEQVKNDGFKKIVMMKEGMMNIFYELLSNSIKFLKKSEKYYQLYNHGIDFYLDEIKYGKNNNENYYHYRIYDYFTDMMRFIYLLFD